MHLYQDQFSERHDFPFAERPTKTLIIASTGRCGSHMLGHALYETRCFGFPLEYSNPANLVQWKARFATTDFAQLLQRIQSHRTSPNGVFGIKIHYSNIRQFGDFGKLQTYFPDAYYVQLSRKDVLRQAVSLSIAKQTGVWIAGQQPVSTEPQYNYQQIDAFLRQTVLENASWRYTLAARGCRYIEMDFDTVRQNIAGAIEQIAAFMELPITDARVPTHPITEKQSNRVDQQWAQQFLADFKGSELLEPERPALGSHIKDKVKRLIAGPMRLGKA